jgi:hypothetical protein
MTSLPDEASEAKSWFDTAEDVVFQRLQEVSSTQLGEFALNLKLDMGPSGIFHLFGAELGREWRG